MTDNALSYLSYQSLVTGWRNNMLRTREASLADVLVTILIEQHMAHVETNGTRNLQASALSHSVLTKLVKTGALNEIPNLSSASGVIQERIAKLGHVTRMKRGLRGEIRKTLERLGEVFSRTFRVEVDEEPIDFCFVGPRQQEREWLSVSEHNNTGLYIIPASAFPSDSNYSVEMLTVLKSGAQPVTEMAGAIPLAGADELIYRSYEAAILKKLRPGMKILYQERSLIPEWDEEHYRRNAPFLTPKGLANPYARSPAGYLLLEEYSLEWVDPKNLRRRVALSQVAAIRDGLVYLSEEGLGMVPADVLEILPDDWTLGVW